MAAGEQRFIHTVQRSRKSVPLVTGGSTCQRVAFGYQRAFACIINSRLIWSNNQSSATLWVRDTCLNVGLLPLIIILMTASLSISVTKWFFAMFLSLFNGVLFALDFSFVRLARFWVCSNLCQLRLSRPEFWLLGDWKRLAHKIAITQRLDPLLSNKIFMISLLSRFNARSRGFMGFDDTDVSCPWSVGISSLQVSSDRLTLRNLQDIENSSDTSNVLLKFFMVILNSMSSGSTSQIPIHFPLLSSFGFFSMRVLADSWTSTMYTYRVFRLRELQALQVFPVLMSTLSWILCFSSNMSMSSWSM